MSRTATPPLPVGSRLRPLWGNRRWLLAGIALLVLFVIGYVALVLWRMSYVPAGLDYSTTRLSEQGLFQSRYTPDTTPIPINQLHTWTLHVETADGQPINDARILVDGDMPQHGHGLPTQPLVTESLGNGDYLVEGMKFQMGGWWVMDFTIEANGQRDVVHFNMLLE